MDIGVNEKNEIFQMNGIVTNVFDEVMNRYNNKNSLSNIWEEVIKKIYNINGIIYIARYIICYI